MRGHNICFHGEIWLNISKLSLFRLLIWSTDNKNNIGSKHGFSCINVCQVPREMLKTEAEGRGFQQFPNDLANVNALENNV